MGLCRREGAGFDYVLDSVVACVPTRRIPLLPLSRQDGFRCCLCPDKTDTVVACVPSWILCPSRYTRAYGLQVLVAHLVALLVALLVAHLVALRVALRVALLVALLVAPLVAPLATLLVAAIQVLAGRRIA
jgi:hypothetical protein